MEVETKDRFLGCLYGLAIGDALGYPVEFMTLDQIKKELGPEGVTGFDSLEKLNPEHPVGSYSDDTQMALATANGLIKSSDECHSYKDVIDNITKEYIAWAESPENNRAPGTTCMAGIANMKAGMHWRKSGIKNGKGCGAAMRTAPIGLMYPGSSHKLILTSELASACTHGDRSAIDAGIATAYAVSEAMKSSCDTEYEYSFKPKNILEEMMNIRMHEDRRLTDKLIRVKEVLKYEDSDKALKELGEGWRGDEAVALAMYCFLKNPYDYKKAVLMAANTNGDSDSIASITGAISGTYNGIKAIPQEWINRIENKDMIKDTALKLYEKADKRWREQD